MPIHLGWRRSKAWSAVLDTGGICQTVLFKHSSPLKLMVIAEVTSPKMRFSTRSWKGDLEIRLVWGWRQLCHEVHQLSGGLEDTSTRCPLCPSFPTRTVLLRHKVEKEAYHKQILWVETGEGSKLVHVQRW